MCHYYHDRYYHYYHYHYYHGHDRWVTELERVREKLRVCVYITLTFTPD